MKPWPTKPLKHISGCLIFWVFIFAISLRGQDKKPKHRIFIGGGIGVCDIVSRELGKTVGGFGPSYSVVFGLHIFEKSSLQLEYIVNHPNDEEPKISDLMVITTIHNGEKYHRFEFVRSPKVFQTKLLLLSFRRNVLHDLFYRIGVGFGANYFNTYRTSEDAVLEARISREIAYALGLAGGYERHISDRLSLALEASVRWSSGEDSSSARFVFGLGTVVKWDF